MEPQTLKTLLQQVREIAKSKKPQGKSSQLLQAQCEAYLTNGIEVFPMETSRYLGEIKFRYITFRKVQYWDSMQFSLDLKNLCIHITFCHSYYQSWQFYNEWKQETGSIYPGITCTFDQLRQFFDLFLLRLKSQGIPITQEDMYQHMIHDPQEKVIWSKQ